MTKRNHDIVTIQVRRMNETDKAVLVTADAPRNAVWVPKSQVEVHEEAGTSLVMLDIPEWLAIDKGLV